MERPAGACGPVSSTVKAMKRLSSTLLVALLLLLVAPRALAADTSWTLPDANLSLSLPSDYAVVTREGIQSHPEVFEGFGLDNEALQGILASTQGYLNGVAPDASSEYMVIVVDPVPGEKRVWNFSNLSDDLLKQASVEIIKEVEKIGYKGAFEKVHRVGDITFMVLTGEAPDGSDYYRQYFTTVNSRMTSVTMHSYNGPITDEQAAAHLQAVDSVSFLSVEADPNPELDPSGLATTAANLGPILRGVGIGVVVAIVSTTVLLIQRGRKKKAAAAAAAAGYAPPQPGQPMPYQPMPGQPMPDQPPAPTVGYPPVQPGPTQQPPVPGTPPAPPGPVPPVDQPPAG